MKQITQIAQRVRDGEQSEWRGIIELEKYKHFSKWKTDGFKNWTAAFQAFIARAKKARSTVLAKLSTVEVLTKANLTIADLEAMGSTNSQHLRRLLKAKGTCGKNWIVRAKKWDTERMNNAVKKAVNPKNAKLSKRWGALLPMQWYERGEKQLARIMETLGIKTREEAMAFLIIQLEATSEEELKHAAGEADATKKAATGNAAPPQAGAKGKAARHAAAAQ